MITLTMNKAEAQALLRILDAAVKGRGLELAKACAVFEDKLSAAARTAAEPEKIAPPVAPTTYTNGATEEANTSH